MSGHNKWSKIKRKKGVADARRSKVWSRIIKEIMVAVKEGGSTEPDFNPRLRVAIANAKGNNMPKENIERAIKKASDDEGTSFTDVNFEAYAPGGVALFVECSTDNNRRTVSSVRSILTKNGGNLATTGSVDFLFDRKAVFIVKQADWAEDDFVLEIIDGGAEDVELEDEEFTITGDMVDFGNLQSKLEAMNMEIVSAELQQIPKSSIAVELETAKSVLSIIDKIEEDDDVKNVFHNMALTDEIMVAMEV